MRWLVKHREFLLAGVRGRDENVLKSTKVKFAQLQYTKSHWTVSFERINSIVREFYLIKPLQNQKTKTRRHWLRKLRRGLGFLVKLGQAYSDPSQVLDEKMLHWVPSWALYAFEPILMEIFTYFWIQCGGLSRVKQPVGVGSSFKSGSQDLLQGLFL